MRQSCYIRIAGISVATVISLIAVLTFLTNNFNEQANRDSDVKFTGTVPSREVATPSSIQFIQLSNDPVAALLAEPHAQSRTLQSEPIPMPRPRPKRP
jgi:hypothetical protein